MSDGISLPAAAVLTAGLIMGGHYIGDGLKNLKGGDRYVSVKGLAEKEVPADLVIWPLGFTDAGNDLTPLYEKLERNARTLREFLIKSGIAEADIGGAAPVVQDLQAQQYGENRAPFRYRADLTLTVRSRNIAAVKAAMSKVGEVVKQGIALKQQEWEQRTTYLFTGLNEIKPQLIADATQNARRAAEQFAKDSESEVGQIRTANQGQITINDREGSPEIKLVRVVTTVEYALKN